MIRAFIALPLPDPISAALEGAQAGMPAGRIVPRENFHITLAFPGEQPGPVIEEVHHVLDMLEAPGFTLRLDGLGMFGGDRPHTLFANVLPEPGLLHLHQKILRAVREVGLWQKRQRFHPHVTLARFGQGGLRGEEITEIQGFIARRISFSAGPFRAERFALYRSYLGRSGPIYETLAAYPLTDRQVASDLPGTRS